MVMWNTTKHLHKLIAKVWKIIEVYLLKLVDLSDKEISIATGNLGVCNMDHILMEDNVIFI